MADFETINQLIELKRQLSHLAADVKALHVSFWEKSTPTIVGGLVGGLVSLLIFWLNQRKEKHKEKFNEEKEYKLTIRRFYGQLAELSQALIIELGSLNVHLINSNYYTHVTKQEKDPDKIKELYERRKRQETAYFDSTKKAGEITSKMSGIIYEYYFLNPDSNILNLHKELQTHKYDIAQNERFNEEMDKEKLLETHAKQIIYAKSEVSLKIAEALMPLLQCIMDENKLEEKLKPALDVPSGLGTPTEENSEEKSQ